VQPKTIDGPAEKAVVLTPKPSPKPRINGAKVFGVRPDNPFLFTIAATGDRPMTFSAEGLPAGLFLDARTGMINGSLKEKGQYLVTLRAKNALGTAERQFKIVCGPQIGLTPALGWNSWNCFAGAVTAEKVKAAADAMVKSGLVNHGWTYINIDDYWEIKPSATNDPTLQGPQRDAEGRILPNGRFSDMKGLVDYVHSLGLKIGLYSGPGPLTCGGCVASYQHEDQDARQYGDWGFDYLKYDWCSYGQIAPRDPNLADYMKPYQVMRASLDKAPRDILYSLCQYGMGNVWEWGEQVGGNSWRTTGDITDTWASLSGIGFRQGGHEKYVGPGHFDDPDMLIVGKVGWGPNLHPTRLTANEQYTHISLWCLLCSPLLIGCDMTQFDDFSLGLLTNDEVLEVNQDPLGRQASRVSKEGTAEVWTKDMEDGSKAVGLFNRSEFEATVKATWQSLGLSGKQKVRDLWRQKDLGDRADRFEAKVPRHGVVLVRLWPAQ
jgi:alpha-galactosidase